MNTSGNRYSMSPIHLYFVLYVSLVGVGLMNFQYKMRGAEKDGWISILAAAVMISIILKMMFVLLSRQSPAIPLSFTSIDGIVAESRVQS